jgi:predicted O-methyltransferase YrrM
MHLHTFLEEVHKVLKPVTYLEIGVQNGTSLRLASACEDAFGVDPNPLWIPDVDSCFTVFPMASDDFYDSGRAYMLPDVNLAFIDGMHRAEQVMRDFINVASHMAPGGIIILDDVLPRNDHEASRTQCPGDWTGDVWRTAGRLNHQPGIESFYVNTTPTGVLVVTDWTPKALSVLRGGSAKFALSVQKEIPVVEEVLQRIGAWEAWPAIERIATLAP